MAVAEKEWRNALSALVAFELLPSVCAGGTELLIYRWKNYISFIRKLDGLIGKNNKIIRKNNKIIVLIKPVKAETFRESAVERTVTDLRFGNTLLTQKTGELCGVAVGGTPWIPWTRSPRTRSPSLSRVHKSCLQQQPPMQNTLRVAAFALVFSCGTVALTVADDRLRQTETSRFRIPTTKISVRIARTRGTIRGQLVCRKKKNKYSKEWLFLATQIKGNSTFIQRWSTCSIITVGDRIASPIC